MIDKIMHVLALTTVVYGIFLMFALLTAAVIGTS